MHSALLIDEILQLILDRCADWDKQEYQYAAAQLARTCVAWKDPALDCIWKNLSDTKPLTRLLDGERRGVGHLLDHDSQHPFFVYASRIKQITLRNCPPVLITETRPLLPNLKTVTLNRAGCFTSPSWLLSEHLQEMEIIIGTLMNNSPAQERGANVALLLQQRRKSFPRAGLSKLVIRGWLCPELAQSIIPLTSLRSLSLVSGHSVTAELLQAITLFPHLEYLQIHTGGVSVDDLNYITPPTNSISCPRLQSLIITGQHPTIIAILECLQPNTLEDLTIEVDTPTLSAPHWKPALDIIATKAAKTLRTLELRHDIDMDEISTYLPSPCRADDVTFVMDPLRALSPLRELRSFTIDTSIPPELTNRDIEDMAVWWPHLERLHLGTLPSLDALPYPWKPRFTTAALTALARRAPKLQTLTLPLDASLAEETTTPSATSEALPQVTQHNLHTLTIGHSSPTILPSTFIQHLLKTFPSLQVVEHDSGKGANPLYTRGARAEIEGVAGEGKRNAGTEDGFADGR
ncbi:hypothetical protein BXZ70DRAFT_1068903 [Cristinia sonorae]|uniref:F-box domain-containing protein n=1 Tax=Cristinia sonorae TaxID=1940300 RepID=A0A8K0UF82_9AGAR|nr:hypothetical protein BXZ70DRAFT_1068903 [Cristinia sonorae]